MFAKYIGLSAETALLIEMQRLTPRESENDILSRVLIPLTDHVPINDVEIGCDLGQGAILNEGESLFLFRRKESRDRRKPEATAEARAGYLYLYGEKVKPSKGSLVQPALKIVQERLNDRNKKGELISLDAWNYWYVNRNKKFFKVSEIRNQEKVIRRKNFLTLEDLDL